MSDSDEHEHNFANGDAGKAHTFQMPASRLRKHGEVILRGQACRIVGLSRTEEHGETMLHVVGTDVFTHTEYEDMLYFSGTADIPNINRTEFALVNIDDGYLNLMDTNGTPKDDIKLPNGQLGNEILENYEAGKDMLITCISAMGNEAAVSYKISVTEH